MSWLSSNAIIFAAIVAICVGVVYPGKMVVSLITTSAILSGFAIFSSRGKSHDFKKEYPATVIGLVLATACLITYLFGSLLVFLVGILFPVLVLVHYAYSSLRNTRNQKVPLDFFLELIVMAFTDFFVEDVVDMYRCVKSAIMRRIRL